MLFRSVLNGNVLYDKSNDININVTLYHDTLRGNWKYTDTLFVLTGENVVREFKGHYFLNTKSFDGYEVMMLTPDRKGFSLKNISDRGMLESLQKLTDVVIITDSNNNVTAYKATPTKKELKKFIRASNADSDGQSFYKIQ